MNCFICGNENPESNKYCWNCGAALDPSTEKLQQQVISVIRQNVRNSDVIAVEIATQVEDRLLRSGKILGSALTILLLALAVFGITSFESARSKIDQTAKASTQELKDVASDRKRDLDTQARTLSGNLQAESQKDEAVLQSYAPREKAVNLGLTRIEASERDMSTRLGRLKQIRDTSPGTPIGAINNQLFQPENETLLGASNSAPIGLILGSNVPVYRIGSTGDGVKAIQNRLTELGCYSGEISGIFDNATSTAVRTFNATGKRKLTRLVPISKQPDFSLEPIVESTGDSGEVGTSTWGALFSPFASPCD